MADITRIEARIKTAEDSGSGTNDSIYLGLAGREFRLDSSADDHDTGDDRTYFLGSGGNVTQAGKNDPRKPQLDTVEVPNFPVYIRKTGTPRGDDDDAWQVDSSLVEVKVNPGSEGELRFRRLFRGSDKILAIQRVRHDPLPQAGLDGTGVQQRPLI